MIDVKVGHSAFQIRLIVNHLMAHRGLLDCQRYLMEIRSGVQGRDPYTDEALQHIEKALEALRDRYREAP